MILWLVASSAWVMSACALGLTLIRRKPPVRTAEQRRPKLSEVAT